MMARHKAGVGRCLARTVESLGGAELAYDDRSGLKTDARDRVQQRASILQLRVLLDVLFDLFLQILNLPFDLVEETAVCTANRLILRLIQPILRSGFLFLEGLPGSRELFKAALRR